jgi:hypothetical protein
MVSRIDFEKQVSAMVNKILNDIANLSQVTAMQHYAPDDGARIAKALRKQTTITCNKLRAFKPVPEVTVFDLNEGK